MSKKLLLSITLGQLRQLQELDYLNEKGLELIKQIEGWNEEQRREREGMGFT